MEGLKKDTEVLHQNKNIKKHNLINRHICIQIYRNNGNGGVLSEAAYKTGWNFACTQTAHIHTYFIL